MEATNSEHFRNIVNAFDGTVIIHFGSDNGYKLLCDAGDNVKMLFPSAQVIFIPPGVTVEDYDKVIHKAKMQHYQKVNDFAASMRFLHLGLLQDDASVEEVTELLNQATARRVFVTPVYFFDLIDADMIMPKLAYHAMQTIQVLTEDAARINKELLAGAMIHQVEQTLGVMKAMAGEVVKESAPEGPSLSEQAAFYAGHANVEVPQPGGSSILTRLAQTHLRNGRTGPVFQIWAIDQDALAELHNLRIDPKFTRLMDRLHASADLIEVVDGKPQVPLTTSLNLNYGVVVHPRKASMVKGGDYDATAAEAMIEAGWDKDRLLQVDVDTYVAFLAEMYANEFGEDVDEDERGLVYASSGPSARSDDSSAKNVVDAYAARVEPSAPVSAEQK